MDAIEIDGSFDSLYSLLRTAELRVSEPQKRMRRGLEVEPLQKRRLAWQMKGRWVRLMFLSREKLRQDTEIMVIGPKA